MGLSQRESIAFQKLLDAIHKSLREGQIKNWRDFTPTELAEHMLDFDQDVDDAAQSFIGAIIADHRDMTHVPELSLEPEPPRSVPHVQV